MNKMVARIYKNTLEKKYTFSFASCELHTILENFLYKYKIGYTAGECGRDSDIYEIDGYYISTGYRPSGKTPKNKKRFLKLEEKAKKLFYDDNFTRDKKKGIAKRLEKSLIKLLEKAGE